MDVVTEGALIEQGASIKVVAVGIAGTFNDWRPQATPMIRLNDGRWAKELALPPGTYEYCLVPKRASERVCESVRQRVTCSVRTVKPDGVTSPVTPR